MAEKKRIVHSVLLESYRALHAAERTIAEQTLANMARHMHRPCYNHGGAGRGSTSAYIKRMERWYADALVWAAQRDRCRDFTTNLWHYVREGSI